MRLEHYRKLYILDAYALYEAFEKKEIIHELLKRFTINDWKEFERDLKKRGESS